MIMGILDNYYIFYLLDLINGGKERIILVLPSEQAYELKKELQSLRKLNYFKQRKTSLSDVITSQFDLTRQERKVLINVINKGYYDFPKKVNLEKLSKDLELSKPTLEEYIRKSEKKIINKIYGELANFEYLLRNDS